MPVTSRGKMYNSLQLGNLFHLFSHKGLFWPDQETIETTVFRKRADWRVISQSLRREGEERDEGAGGEEKRKARLSSFNSATELTRCSGAVRKLHVSVPPPSSVTALCLSPSICPLWILSYAVCVCVCVCIHISTDISRKATQGHTKKTKNSSIFFVLFK